MRKILKRLLSFMLVLTMLFGILPETALTVFAEEHQGQVRVIVENTKLSVNDGATWEGRIIDEWININQTSSAMSVVVEALDKNNYYCEGAENNYITNINDLAAGTYNGMDGWMIIINDWFIDNGAGYYTVADGTLNEGDEICVSYSLTMGEDLGGTYSNNDTSLKDIQFSVGEITQEDVSISDVTNNGEHENLQLHYTLTVPAGTTNVVVTPTARNKNFQVRTYLNFIDTATAGFKRSAEIPISNNGDTIWVVCGDSSWPSMNTNTWGNGLPCYATQYAFHIVYDSTSENKIPTINVKGDADDDEEDGLVEKTSSCKVGDTYTIKMSELFEVSNATFSGFAEIDKILDEPNPDGTDYNILNEYKNLTLDSEIRYTFTEAGTYDFIALGMIEEDEDAGVAYIETISVESVNHAPTLTEEYKTGSGTVNIYKGEEFTIDLSEIFTDEDHDTLTYTVSVDGLDEVALNDSSYTYSDTADEKNATLVFTANDGKEIVSYTVTLNIEKKIAALNSLIIHSSTSPNNSNVLLKNASDSYTTNLTFDPATKEYELSTTLTDSTNQLRFRAEPNANASKVTLCDADGNTIKDITWTSGSSKWANFLVGGMNEFKIVVTSEDPNVESTTYSFKIGVIPTLTALTAENTYWDKSFSTTKTEYTMTVPANISTVTLNAIPKSEGYTVTFNGAASNVVDITNIEKIDVVVSKDGLSNCYTLKLEKPTVTDVEFKVIPSDAAIMVYDHTNNIVVPNADGSYTGMFGTYNYTYSISKNGYISQTAAIPEAGGTIDITLEKVLGKQPEEVDSFWSNFRGSETNMAITDTRTPQNKDADNIAVKWTKSLGSGWSNNPSVQIIVDNALIVMSNKTLYKLDLESGEILAQAEMVAAPNFGYTPPTYAAGMIFCPLSGGTVQAFNAKTLESLWVYKDALGGQSLSPITYSDGYIYTGFWNGETKNANFVCISIADEDVDSSNESKIATWKHTQLGGFYWAGAVVTNDTVIVGTDDGESGTEGTSKLYSFNKKNGEIISSLDLTGAGDQRSSIAYVKENGRIYFTTKGGYLYRANVDTATGTLTGLKGVDNNAQTTSTPVVYNGRVYYATGSGISSTGSSGNVVVADAETLEMMFAVGLKGYPQCSLLLSTAYERTTGYLYLYSTYNNNPGGISVIKVKADCLTASDAELTELYDAKGFEQYCIASILCGEDGTLYYKNDSGNIFAIGVPSVINVEKLIDLIGTVSIDSKGAISAARGAYDALGLLEQASVSNYDTLVAAEALYKEYEKADAVDQKILAIGKVTNSSETAIQSARVAYDALNDSEKEKVTKLSILTAAEAALKEIKDLDLEEIENVEKLIDAIGQVTVSSEYRIKKARNAFDKLTASQKRLVSNLDDLLDAEDALDEVKVQAVEDKIDSIGTVTLNSKAAINRARTAYNNLSASNKKSVGNLSTLESAEKEYAELLAESKTTKKSTTTTAKVNALKSTMSSATETTSLNKVTLSAKELLENVNANSYNGEIIDAIMAYESLTDEEKFLLKKDALVEELKTQLSNRIQVDESTAISVSGAEWNTQLIVEDVLDITEIQLMQEHIENGQMLGLWNIFLENVVDGQKYSPLSPVLIKIPLSELGDFTSYDGLVIIHYTDQNTIEYLNCTVIGDCLVFNAIDFSNFAVVGYNGESPIEGLMTATMNEEAVSADLTWIPWAIAGGCGIAVLALLIILIKKNKNMNLM